MLTRNVYYAERPESVIVTRNGRDGYTARVDLPVNIQEVPAPVMEGEEPGTQFMADVYSITAGYTEDLKERVEEDYEAWLTVAKRVPVPEPTLQDAIDAINELAEIVLGGE